ncbi:MAG TPA: type II toxin-antitoxin system VapC family toxin [Thermomicrobiales bacterium]
MSEIVVDASVWISALLSKDVNHGVSRAWRRAWIAAGGTFTLPLLILPEVAGAVARRTGQARLGDRAVATIVANPRVTLVSVDRQLARLAAEHASSSPLKGSDAVYTALAEQLSVPLVTWDNEQLTRVGGRVRVQQPAV